MVFLRSYIDSKISPKDMLQHSPKHTVTEFASVTFLARTAPDLQ